MIKGRKIFAMFNYECDNGDIRTIVNVLNSEDFIKGIYVVSSDYAPALVGME